MCRRQCGGCSLCLTNLTAAAALHYAVNIGNVDVVKILLAAEADVMVTDDMGFTAISLTDDPKLHELLQVCPRSLASEPRCKL